MNWHIVLLVLFWASLIVGLFVRVMCAFDAGRRRQLQRCRTILARRRRARTPPAENVF